MDDRDIIHSLGGQICRCGDTGDRETAEDSGCVSMEFFAHTQGKLLQIHLLPYCSKSRWTRYMIASAEIASP